MLDRPPFESLPPLSRAEAGEARAAARTLAALAAVAEVGRLLTGRGALGQRLAEAMAVLGTALEVDRSMVFRHEHPEGSGTGPMIGHMEAEWVRSGIPPTVQNYPADLREGVDAALLRTFEQGRPIVVVTERLDEGPTREVNLAGLTRSMLIVPIEMADRIWGNLCLDDCAVVRDWSEHEIAALCTAAAAVAGAVEREALAEARLAAERARAEESWRTTTHLQAVAAGSRRLVDATDFEAALLEWLAEMGRAAGAARATYYDTAVHAESGLRTLRVLAEWTRDGVGDSHVVSFAEPLVIDPRGDEEGMAAALDSEITTVHTENTTGPVRAHLEAQGNATVLTVPVRLDGETRFALSLDYLQRREPTEADLAVLRTAADSLVSVLRRREAEAARLEAERARAADSWRTTTHLQAVAAGSRRLVDATDFEAALLEWLAEMGRAAGAARAAYYDAAMHAENGLRTLRALAEWAREDVGDNVAVSFAEPYIMDPRGAEELVSAALGTEIVAFHTDRTTGPMRALLEAQGNATVLTVPIRLDGATRFALSLDYLERRDPTEADLAVLRTAADSLVAVLKRREAEAARLDAERARAEESWRTTTHLQAVAAGSRRLVNATDFETALLDWLAEMGRAAGAARAAYYDTATHAETGLRTLRALSEWTREGVAGSNTFSFAEPLVLDPRGVEALMAAALGADITAAHTVDTTGAMRAQMEAQGNATVLIVPIRLDGETRFALSLDYLERRDPTEADLAVLRTAADSLVAVLKRREAEAARLDAERERSALLAAVNEAGTRLLTPPGTRPPIGEALAVVGAAMRLDGFVYGVFEGPDEGSALGYIRWTEEWLAGDAIRSVFDPTSVGRANLDDQAMHVADYVVGRETFLPDIAALPPPLRAYMESYGVRAAFGVPVMVDGGPVGSLSGVTATPRIWSAADVQALHLLAAAIGSALSRERQVQARIAAEAARATEAQSAAAALARRRDLLEAVVAASDRLLAAEGVEEGAAEVVARIGPALAADRVLVSRFLPPDGASPVGYVHFFSEWAAPGIARQTDDPALTVFDMAHYLDFLHPLQRGEAVQMITDDIADAAGQVEQAATGARSQFQYPIMVDGALWGTIGADDCRAPRQWDEAEIATLRLVASALGSVVARERLGQARLAAERELAEERGRMAREIHDTLAQSFTGIIMQANAAEDALEAADAAGAARHTARAIERASMGLAEARRSVYALRPPLLDEGDLAGALRVVAARVFDGVAARADLVVAGELPALPEPISVELFRIAQEALGNALRHARAGVVTVTLDATVPGRLALLVADDGVGFDPAATRPGGFGLVSMRERATRLGSRLVVETAPGAGTRVSVAADLSALIPLMRPAVMRVPSLLPDLR